MKKITTAFLCTLLLVALTIPAYAQDDSNSYTHYIEYQEDGSYFAVDIIQASTSTRSNTTSGTKRAVYYDDSDTPIFAVEVTGSFTYTGTSATADSAASAVYIYDQRATFVNKGEYTSGAAAVGYANINFNSRSIYKSVTLTCSKDGKLS